MILILYFCLNLIGITLLPVFSDEAIYIHWAQVATREPSRYAFLPMLDGKPPLHVWSMMPLLQVIQDPLLAGRLVSVSFGALNVLLIGLFVRQLGGKQKDERLAQLAAMFLPFWFFHNRMALAETMLVMWMLLGLVSAIHVYKRCVWKWMGLFTLAVGAALWTKMSALFFIPVFLLVPLLVQIEQIRTTFSFRTTLHIIKVAYWNQGVFRLFVAGLFGGLIFLLLRFSPLFPYLFSRSSDYAFTLQDLLHGEWRFVLAVATPRLLLWLLIYLSPFTLFLALWSGRRGMVLFGMTLAFILPLLIGGRVVYSRYFLPVAVPLTAMAVFGFRELYSRQGKMWKGLALGSMVGMLVWSSAFILPSYVRPGLIPLAKEDRAQYMTEWSSGYGIPQVRDYLRNVMQQHPIMVGTEGYFGTLPDGLSIYFNRPEDAGNH
jgi:hypothetical protein